MANVVSTAIDSPSGESRGEFIENLPFTIDAGTGARAKVGLIVLASDYTMEHEFAAIYQAAAAQYPGINFYVARIENETHINSQTLAAMERKIAPTVRLLLPGEKLDVVAYGCTSASVVMGEQTVFSRVREVHPEIACTTPITAAFAAFSALKAKRIAVLTPYQREVNLQLRRYIERAGFEVPVFGSFNEPEDPVVARIDSASLASAIERLVDGRDVDMVFVSCTSVRLATAVAELERSCHLPVTSSNLAMAWHSLKLAGLPALDSDITQSSASIASGSLDQFGGLYRLPAL